jgi:hypothetical protein
MNQEEMNQIRQEANEMLWANIVFDVEKKEQEKFKQIEYGEYGSTILLDRKGYEE